MANLNERNQQILGYLGILGGAFRDNKFGDGTPKGKHASAQAQFYDASENARITIRKYGIEKVNLTYVRVGVPNMFMQGKVNDPLSLAKEVNFRAERVNQPGIQLATSSVRRYGVGTIEKRPFAAMTNDINVSFIGDARGVIHQYFYVWMNGIVNAYNMPDGSAEKDIFDKFPGEVEYANDYRTTVEVVMYDEERKLINTVKLYNAYPIAVGDIQRDWSGVNDLVRVNVTFAYSHWAYSGNLLEISEPTRETLASQKTSLIDSAMQGMSAIQAISSIKRPQNVNDILNVVNTGSTLLKAFLPRGLNY